MYWGQFETRRARFAGNSLLAALTCSAAMVLVVMTLMLANGVRRERDALLRIEDAGLAASSRMYDEYRAEHKAVEEQSEWLSLPSGVWVVLATTWFRRSYRNLSSFNLDGWQASRLGVVWSCLLPVVNLFRPLVLMDQVWRGSHPEAVDSARTGRDWRRLPVSHLLGVTWVALILSYAPLSLLVGGDDSALSAHIAQRMSVLALLVVRVLAFLLTILVVIEVTARQRAAHVRLIEARVTTA
jgi:hypothetical protein